MSKKLPIITHYNVSLIRVTEMCSLEDVIEHRQKLFNDLLYNIDLPFLTLIKVRNRIKHCQVDIWKSSGNDFKWFLEILRNRNQFVDSPYNSPYNDSSIIAMFIYEAFFEHSLMHYVSPGIWKNVTAHSLYCYEAFLWSLYMSNDKAYSDIQYEIGYEILNAFFEEHAINKCKEPLFFLEHYLVKLFESHDITEEAVISEVIVFFTNNKKFRTLLSTNIKSKFETLLLIGIIVDLANNKECDSIRSSFCILIDKLYDLYHTEYTNKVFKLEHYKAHATIHHFVKGSIIKMLHDNLLYFYDKYLVLSYKNCPVLKERMQIHYTDAQTPDEEDIEPCKFVKDFDTEETKEKIVNAAITFYDSISPYINESQKLTPEYQLGKLHMQSTRSLLIGEYAKVLCSNGIKTGQNRLFKWFRNHKYMNKRNRPYQQYVESGLFELKQSFVKTDEGGFTTLTPKITAKGQAYFAEILRREYNASNTPVEKDCV